MKSKYLLLLLASFHFNSCKTKTTLKNFYNVEVIKFMGTLSTQPYSVDEEMFWIHKSEHAKLLINDIGFINDIQSITDSTSTNFEDYKYAFIVKKDKQTDTLYSDYTLKTWILKKGNKQRFYYDKKGETAENLRHMFSFFKDCW